MTVFGSLRLLSAIAIASVLMGCAHPIVVSAEKTPERVEQQLVQKKVAYVMTDEDRAKEVITAGGGGDRISYYPYRDLERAIREALRSVYSEVVVVRSASDTNDVRNAGVTLIFKPEIKTSSSSPSPFTWPPTNFTTEISCKVSDASGKEIAQISASGSGNAEFSEFKSNVSLAANRAGTEVAGRLSAEIRANDKLR